jgi:hypothetical protein
VISLCLNPFLHVSSAYALVIHATLANWVSSLKFCMNSSPIPDVIWVPSISSTSMLLLNWHFTRAKFEIPHYAVCRCIRTFPVLSPNIFLKILVVGTIGGLTSQRDTTLNTHSHNQNTNDILLKIFFNFIASDNSLGIFFPDLIYTPNPYIYRSP